MKGDIGSNYVMVASDVGDGAGAAVASDVVDHADAPSVAFLVNVISTTTVDAKAQWSDDNSTWTDDDGSSGNAPVGDQISGSGVVQINIANPVGRYSRLMVTSVGATVATCSSVLGPLRHAPTTG